MQPCIDQVNNTISNVEHAKKKIKIGTIAEPEFIKECVDDVRKVCDWAPADVQTCPSSETLSSPAAISFLDKHVRKGTYKLELLKDPSCRCKFCKITAKRDDRVIGHVQCPLLKDDGTYSLLNERLPVGNQLEEK